MEGAARYCDKDTLTSFKGMVRIDRCTFSLQNSGLGLLHVLLFLRGVPLHHIIIHGAVASAAGAYVLWYYIQYVKYADENAVLVRMTLTGTIRGGA